MHWEVGDSIARDKEISGSHFPACGGSYLPHVARQLCVIREGGTQKPRHMSVTAASLLILYRMPDMFYF